MNNYLFKRNFSILFSCVLSFSIVSCRTDAPVIPSEQHETGDSSQTDIRGFYLLNEGNLGSNKASLDYYDFATGTYTTDIYASRNPSVVKELGDVGNDLQIYGHRMYAVINASNKVEVMTADSAIRIGHIDVPNCRCLAFEGKYGYVTSYAGPIVIGEEHAQIGYVLKFDTATLQTIDTCHVGFQPEGIAIANGKLYVANSGGYLTTTYDTTMSVIDLTTFKQTKRLNIDINMQHVMVDKYNRIWVNSLGNYYETPSRLYCIDTNTDKIVKQFDFPVTNFCLSGDSIYFYSTAWNYTDMTNSVSYGILNIATMDLLTQHFIIDGTESDIEIPYGISVNPISHDIYITDAKTYTIPGALHCYSAQGEKKWSVRTGDIPAHFCFLTK